ncbi:MAG: hypothetical protein Q4F49_05815 [Pseudoxanthomonas suwonensis]|nr:hypothetical protein [Pseudoxanthomonas suwonensis]
MQIAVLLFAGCLAATAHAQRPGEAPPPEQPPITDDVVVLDYVVMSDSVVATASAIGLEQVYANGQVGSFLYDRHSGQTHFVTGTTYITGQITPDDLERNRNKPRFPKLPGLPGVIAELVYERLSGSGQSDEERRGVARSVGSETCRLARQSADTTIQMGMQSCAAAGGSFSLINGGDVCGNNVAFRCELRTHTEPQGP